MSLSATETDINEIYKSNKKLGITHTLLLQIQKLIPTITLALISIGGDILIKNYTDSKFQQTINAVQKVAIVNQNNIGIKDTNELATSMINIESNILGESSKAAFDLWIDQYFTIDQEGFHCPNTNRFDYWHIWSMNSIPVDTKSISIKFMIKPKQYSKSQPIFSIKYGQYIPGGSPIAYWTLNIFDSPQSIRLYDSHNTTIMQEYMPVEVDTTSEIQLELRPRTIPNTSSLNINPQIRYLEKNNAIPTTFTPINRFEIKLPLIDLEAKDNKYQIGLGSSKDSCFKLTSFEYSKN